MKTQKIPKRSKSHPSHTPTAAPTTKRRLSSSTKRLHTTKLRQVSLQQQPLSTQSAPSQSISSYTIAAPVTTHTFPSITTRYHQQQDQESSPTSCSTTQSLPIDLSQNFDVGRTMRRGAFQTTNRTKTTLARSQQSITHQSSRHFVINRPKNYHQSLYGTELTPKNVQTFEDLYSNHPKTKMSLKNTNSQGLLSDLAPKAQPSQRITDMTKKSAEDFLMSNGNNPLSISNIDPAQLKDKRVFLRSDLNFIYEIDPDTNNNDFRLTNSSLAHLTDTLPTLQYILDAGAQVIMASPASPSTITTPSKTTTPHSFVPVAKALSKLLNKQVTFVKNPLTNDGHSLKQALSQGQVIFLENFDFQEEAAETDEATIGDDSDATDKILDIIQPGLCVYDSLDFQDNRNNSIATRTNSASSKIMAQLTKKAIERSVPSVAGMLVAKELNNTRLLYNAIQGRLQQRKSEQPKSKNKEKNQPSPSITKTLIMGAPSFTSLVPILRTSFDSTQNFIFANKSSYMLSHVAHIAEASMSSKDAELSKSLIPTRSTPVFHNDTQGITRDDASTALVFMSNAAKGSKSVWMPHDWTVTNGSNPNSVKMSLSTLKLYDKASSVYEISDIGSSSRKDFAWAVDNVIAQQLEGKDQIIFWFGSMNTLSQDNTEGNSTIIESLHKATDAGVITVVGGAEAMEAIDIYKKNYPQRSRVSIKTAVESPQFSFISTSPGIMSSVLGGANIFGDLAQNDKF